MNKKTPLFKAIYVTLLFIIITVIINIFTLIPGIITAFSMENGPVSIFQILSVSIGLFIFATYVTYLNMVIFTKLITKTNHWYFVQLVFWIYLSVSIGLTFILLPFLDSVSSWGLVLPWHTWGGHLNNVSPFFVDGGYYKGLTWKEIVFVGMPIMIFSLSIIYLLLHRKFKKYKCAHSPQK